MPFDLKGRPNVIPWPPVLMILLAAAAVALGTAVPAPPPPPDWAIWSHIAGAALCAAGIGLDLWAIVTMYRHRTNVLPHRAADRLVTSGPFGFSRNPIYLGNTALLAGIALPLGNPYFLLAAAVNAVLVNKLAIAREETHLASRFPSEWPGYTARVRRWIGRAKRP